MTIASNSTAICVLGPHRSGTSTITRSLNFLGAYLGENNNLLRPLPENPEGFWERLDIYYLQERLLAALKRDWAAVAPLPENWQGTDMIRPLRSELVQLVKKEFVGQSLWCWKDPRTCLLLPLWREVLNELNINLKAVFVVRSPLDVAKSLQKRNGFPMDKGLAIWFTNTITALSAIKGLDTVFLSYDSFLENWQTELKRCASDLGIGWPVDEAALKCKMDSFLRGDLRHSSSGLDDLYVVNAPAPVVNLYRILREILASNLDYCSSTESIEALYQQFVGYARLYEADINTLTECRSVHDQTANSSRDVTDLKRELDSRSQWAWHLDEETKMLRGKVALLEKRLSEQCVFSSGNELGCKPDTGHWPNLRALWLKLTRKSG